MLAWPDIVSAVDEDDLSYYSGDFLQDILEVTLLELGGPELLADAHDEAGGYVDEHYPWNGEGEEPAERVSAYCAVLWQRAEHARGAGAPAEAPRPVDGLRDRCM